VTVAKVSDEEFIEIFESSFSIEAAAAKMGLKIRGVMARRKRIEHKYGVILTPKSCKDDAHLWPTYDHLTFEQKSPFDVMIVSDRHAMPGEIPPAFVVACHVLEELQPKVLICNGDWYDLPAMSRHVQRGWEGRPKVADEIIAGTTALKELRELSPKSKRYFTLGNHDMRFDGKIAELMAELEDVEGMRLIDHIDKTWYMTISLSINDNFMVKHRFRSGMHAAWNNVLHGGVNIATGHTHRCLVRPFTDYNGTRYAMETGCISDINSETFGYCENNPREWQPGFMVVHVDGQLISPEPVRVVQDTLHPKKGKGRFRGKWFG
jgi:hypothetical protein